MKKRPTRGMGDRCLPESCLMKNLIGLREEHRSPTREVGQPVIEHRFSATMHLRLSLINEINTSNKLFIFLGIQ